MDVSEVCDCGTSSGAETCWCSLSKTDRAMQIARLRGQRDELLEACELVANEPCLERFFGEDIANTLRAAIKKAKGE